MRFPLRLPRKGDRHVQKCARRHNESAVATSTRREMHVDDFERNEWTVNSIELAAHARATQRSNTGA